MMSLVQCRSLYLVLRDALRHFSVPYVLAYNWSPVPAADSCLTSMTRAERRSMTHGWCMQLRPCDTTADEPALAACAWTHPVQTLRSSTLLSKQSSTTVSVRVDPAAVRRRLASSTTFCVWSPGASCASLNHWRPCSCRRRSRVPVLGTIFQ